MIRVEVEQNTPEWETLRLGVVTASQMHKIITPTGKASAQADGYMWQLIAEKLTGTRAENYKSEWMERGHEIEEEAANYLEFTAEQKLIPGGFIFKDEQRRVGCSPDRLVGNENIGSRPVIFKSAIEIKCPLQQTCVQYLCEESLSEEYRVQVQSSLFITDFPHWNILAYHPKTDKIPPLLIRVERDEKFITQISEKVEAFIKKMDEKIEKIRSMK